jgi:hypothetical protein
MIPMVLEAMPCMSEGVSCAPSHTGHAFFTSGSSDIVKYSLSPAHHSLLQTVSYYSSAPVSVGNVFQDLPRLYETADNTELYI